MNKKKYAKELRKKGLSYKKIAEELGVSDSTVFFWLNLDKYKIQKEINRKYMKERYRDDEEFRRRMKKYAMERYKELIKWKNGKKKKAQ